MMTIPAKKSIEELDKEIKQLKVTRSKLKPISNNKRICLYFVAICPILLLTAISGYLIIDAYSLVKSHSQPLKQRLADLANSYLTNRISPTPQYEQMKQQYPLFIQISIWLIDLVQINANASDEHFKAGSIKINFLLSSIMMGISAYACGSLIYLKHIENKFQRCQQLDKKISEKEKLLQDMKKNTKSETKPNCFAPRQDVQLKDTSAEAKEETLRQRHGLFSRKSLPLANQNEDKNDDIGAIMKS